MGRRVGLSALHNSVFVRHIRTRQLSIWSDENVRELNSIMRDSPEIAIMKSNKDAFIQMIKDNYKAKTEKLY